MNPYVEGISRRAGGLRRACLCAARRQAAEQHDEMKNFKWCCKFILYKGFINTLIFAIKY
jgi:hypothetical protein